MTETFLRGWFALSRNSWWGLQWKEQTLLHFIYEASKQTRALAAPCPPLVKQELTCTMPVLFASILTNGLSYALGLSQALCSRGNCICRNKWEKKAVLLFQQMHVKCSWKCLYFHTFIIWEQINVAQCFGEGREMEHHAQVHMFFKFLSRNSVQLVYLKKLTCLCHPRGESFPTGTW